MTGVISHGDVDNAELELFATEICSNNVMTMCFAKSTTRSAPAHDIAVWLIIRLFTQNKRLNRRDDHLSSRIRIKIRYFTLT